MQLVWTKQALEQLLEVEAFIARDSRDRAAKFIDQMVDYAEKSLPTIPTSAGWCPRLPIQELESCYSGNTGLFTD